MPFLLPSLLFFPHSAPNGSYFFTIVLKLTLSRPPMPSVLQTQWLILYFIGLVCSIWHIDFFSFLKYCFRSSCKISSLPSPLDNLPAILLSSLLYLLLGTVSILLKYSLFSLTFYVIPSRTTLLTSSIYQ